MEQRIQDQYELDYYRIEKAIIYLRDTRGSRPVLEHLAAHVGMSQYHFQRLFSRWAGISPKKFVQYLTLQHAKNLLSSSSFSVMDTALETGLSGSGRLHDLFIKMEAMTPGQYSRGGRKLEIRYGFHPTPFGRTFVCMTDRGICGLSFTETGNESTVLAYHRNRWPQSLFREDRDETERLLARMFPEDRTKNSSTDGISCVVRGTAFQCKVWEALLSIPAGAVTTYSAIASAIGSPTSVRAAANAVGANPIAYLIPCHRVIRSSGALGGYRWGLVRKQAMLARESAQETHHM